MRLKLSTKIATAVAGVVALAVLSSVVSLLSARQMARLLALEVTENFLSIRAAEELEVALLEQIRILSSPAKGGGNNDWLKELQSKREDFEQWLVEARSTSHTAEERTILENLEQAYRQYQAVEKEAVAIRQAGHRAQAEALLAEKGHDSYTRAYNQCEKFIDANQAYIDTERETAQAEIQRVTWLVAGCVALTILLGASLLGLFFRGVLLPLRKMAADAKRFTGGQPEQDGAVSDELGTVGTYLRTLMSDVADTRSVLQESRHRMLQAERLASVGKLAASVAHEIRNPLTSIKMWLFSLEKAMGSDPALQRRLTIISEEIGRLESIVRNFLEFSRPPALKRRAQDVGTLIDKTLELFSPQAEKRQLRLVRSDSPQLCLAMADGEQIKQVLINLLNNAADAAPLGGQICLRATAETEPDGRPMVVIRVQDTGPGMPEEVRRRIFEPFFTTKEGGTGLGLCIAARIMARHEGRLVLESSGERGTSFAVWIPSAQGDGHESHTGS